MREDALRRGPSPSVHKYQLVAFMTSPVTSVRPDLINSLAVDLSRLEVEDIPDPWKALLLVNNWTFASNVGLSCHRFARAWTRAPHKMASAR